MKKDYEEGEEFIKKLNNMEANEKSKTWSMEIEEHTQRKGSIIGNTFSNVLSVSYFYFKFN